jgi:hypothetical protein
MPVSTVSDEILFLFTIFLLIYTPTPSSDLSRLPMPTKRIFLSFRVRRESRSLNTFK